MLKNYLAIALRSMRRYAGYTAINVVGLAACLAAFILILLFVQHELSYDRFHENAGRIYRVVQRQSGYVYLGTDVFASTPAPLAATLVEEYPEVAAATPIMSRSVLLGSGDQHFSEEGIWADEHFFDVFTVTFLHGSPETALAEPHSVVLTESLARKIFGEGNPVGQTLLYQDEELYTVTGVASDVPTNSSLRYAFIADYPISEIYYEGTWNSSAAHTFFLLADGADEVQFQAKLPALVEKYKYAGREDVVEEGRDQYRIQPLTDVHLRSTFNFDMAFTGDIRYVYLFSAIGLVILLLASVNYTNLAVARSIKRAREVGMRKVVGARRRQLIGQFLGESVLISFLALVLALGLVHLLLPNFGRLVERPIDVDYLQNGVLLPALLTLVVLVGLLSGSYPAFFMASLRPMETLKGTAAGLPSRSRLQRLLIVGQFAVSIALVAGSFAVYQQMQYVQQKELGYDREQVVTVPVRDEALRENYAAIREEWMRNPRVVAVTSSWDLPTEITFSQQIKGWEAGSAEDHLEVRRMDVDYGFVDVFGMEIAAGRTFSPDVVTDAENGYMINETATRALGWTPQEAVGKHFTHMGGERTIIGVVKDFHMQSMHFPIEPLIILLSPNVMQYISARVQTEDLPETAASLERSLKRFTPYPFEYQFLDEQFDELYKSEVRLGETIGFFTILALLIASLGLFGLAAFAAEQRTKEIGIRKVLGADVTGLVALLSIDFLKLVAFAFVVGAPVAFFAMQRWLEDFAYRIDLGPGVFILAGGAALAIALLAVSYQSVRAALADPVKSLRYE